MVNYGGIKVSNEGLGSYVWEYSGFFLSFFNERRLSNKKLTNTIEKITKIIMKANIYNVFDKFDHQTLEYKLLSHFFARL